MLWCSGGFTLRFCENGRVVSSDEPHGKIGRAPGSTQTIDDPAVSSRHVYLHLDRRGLFAVDQATRTGTRVGAGGGPWGWLRPGDRLEVAGHWVEVVEVRLASGSDDAGVGNECPLDDTGVAPFVRLTLHPSEPPHDPLSLNSQLVFMGRSPSCAVPVHSPSAMRVHCVLVRAADAAYVVDLVGRGTLKNERPFWGADRLLDGDSLRIGSARFLCLVEPAGSPPTLYGPPALSLGAGSLADRPSQAASAPAPIEDFAPPLDLIPPEAQAAVLGWLMNQIQSRQDESYRRQSEFQTELVRLVAEIHRDNQSVLQRHLERADTIHDELSQLREEMKRRFGGAAPGLAGLSGPRPKPLRIAPIAPPEDPEAAASWLINRVNQLDQEAKSSWKDLLGRISGRKAAE
ncbi:MAG: odhI 2 [Actinomycetia bacterium]|nr:odhI 2 [Actinomycetes bacterium]